jgi:CRP/FNR family cyclic AMP-dependent transcriptional regulator
MQAQPPDGDPWFSKVAQAHREALLARARVSQAAAGARVYGLGDPPDGLWSVAEGEVRLIAYPADGMESVALILGPGAWFGELSVIDGGPRPHDAVVSKAGRLMHVPLGAVEQVVELHPGLYRDLARLLCARQRGALNFMSQSIAQPISVRLRQALFSAARAAGGVELEIRQEDLAAMIGVSRQTVNKELRRLEEAGVVARAYGRIRVLDPQRLRRRPA